MNDLSTQFIRWYFNTFVDIDPLYVTMTTISENSPWHREINVGVHTNMVVGEFLTRIKNPWSMRDLYGAFACAFHDVGKPAARKEAYKPERGTYYRYGGHELISARLWEDWASRNWHFLTTTFNFNPQSIYNVGWLIENHLPWDIKKTDKREQLMLGANKTIGIDVFISMVKADSWGRISDDVTEKRKKVTDWCNEFKYSSGTVIDNHKHAWKNPDTPILYMPIAASGSGKSTFMTSKTMQQVLKSDHVDELLHYSLDALRLAWYDMDDYSKAWQMASDDNTFKSRANNAFVDMVKTGKSIYLDNLNISKKVRGFFIRTARQYGYNVSAILFPIELQTIKDRQASRTDKSVNLRAVESHYMGLHLPSHGEVDDIIIASEQLFA